MKPKLFVDFDSTIVASIKAFCQTYNQLYKYNKGFKPADWTRVNRWDFSDQCPLLENKEAINNIFSSKHFFKRLEFMPNAKEIIYKLHKNYDIIIVTIGSHINLARKSMWIYQNLGFIKDMILIYNEKNKMDKSIVNMGKNSILIDDVASNLESVNAEIKICYGKYYPWNANWNGLRAYDWETVYSLLKLSYD